MKKLMAANWKMYKTAPEAARTVTELAGLLNGACPDDREVLLFPPFTALYATVEAMSKLAGGMVGAQDVYPAEEGAFTGEISPRMIKDTGAAWVLTGHSERRHVMGESDELVGKKTAFALEQGFKVVLCIGETLEEREAGKLGDVLERQLQQGLAGLPDNVDPEHIAVAYEPVWAIGTGKTAQNSDIVDAHAMTRDIVKEIMGPNGLNVRLLYGGSVKPDNASSIITLDNVDGVLVGGASLQADSFQKIVTA